MRGKQALPSGSAVGIDPTLFSIGRARLFRQALTTAGIRLVSVTPNLVDEVRSGAFIDSRRRGRSSSPARACVWLAGLGEGQALSLEGQSHGAPTPLFGRGEPGQGRKGQSGAAVPQRSGPRGRSIGRNRV
jgi:hypothetical protein